MRAPVSALRTHRLIHRRQTAPRIARRLYQTAELSLCSEMS